MKFSQKLLLKLSIVFLLYLVSIQLAQADVAWEPWSDDVFKRATKENKLVLLNLEAVWCHWCHVMEASTYKDPRILALLGPKIIPLKVDQDARPDLSNRYRDYGWPATILFNSDGREIRKFSGYISPDEMARALSLALKDPSPIEEERLEIPAVSALPSALKAELLRRHEKSLDHEQGGLRTSHKYLDAETLLYAFSRRKSQPKESDFFKTTLRSNLQLLDPVWGGVYQYSTHRSWSKPHFEKIVLTQARNISLYSLGGQAFDEEEFRTATGQIVNYLKNFLLSPEGAFYTSQDADVVRGEHSGEYFALSDIERRKLGVPRVDTNIYTRENGMLIEALAFAGSLEGKAEYLELALRAAEWVLANRRLPQSTGFRHGEALETQTYLGDPLMLAKGFVELYTVTGERRWLKEAEAVGNYIQATYQSKEGGYLTTSNSALSAVWVLIENIDALRFFNRLYHYTGNENYRASARHALPILSTEKFALGSLTEAGILLADDELGNAPLHLTIVGPKQDEAAQKLFQAALRYPEPYRRVEWWDAAEGALPNPDVQYPKLLRAAAFICTNKRCSMPIFSDVQVQATIERLLKK